MNNLANQEYTDDHLLIGKMLLHLILQMIAEESGLKFDAFDLRADKKKDRYILVIWRNRGKFEPIQLSNKQIAGCSLSEANKEEMKELLRTEMRRIR